MLPAGRTSRRLEPTLLSPPIDGAAMPPHRHFRGTAGNRHEDDVRLPADHSEVRMMVVKWRKGLLVLVSLAAIVALSMSGPIPQDPAYHRFADVRAFAGMPNFCNVVSNLAFIAIGVFGLWRTPRLAAAQMRSAYRVLCAAVILVGFGSAYYHHAPGNATLLWDRLPMTVAFMALLTLLLEERVLDRHQPGLLWVLASAGAGSAVYWALTESLGQGDLRPYILVQFLPMVLIPLIVGLFPRGRSSNRYLFAALGLYGLAKLLETFDTRILELGSLVSGHSLKHVAAAAAVLCIIRAVPTRA